MGLLEEPISPVRREETVTKRNPNTSTSNGVGGVESGTGPTEDGAVDRAEEAADLVAVGVGVVQGVGNEVVPFLEGQLDVPNDVRGGRRGREGQSRGRHSEGEKVFVHERPDIFRVCKEKILSIVFFCQRIESLVPRSSG